MPKSQSRSVRRAYNAQPNCPQISSSGARLKCTLGFEARLAMAVLTDSPPGITLPLPRTGPPYIVGRWAEKSPQHAEQDQTESYHQASTWAGQVGNSFDVLGYLRTALSVRPHKSNHPYRCVCKLRSISSPNSRPTSTRLYPFKSVCTGRTNKDVVDLVIPRQIAEHDTTAYAFYRGDMQRIQD
jgi:hypothetical protein